MQVPGSSTPARLTGLPKPIWGGALKKGDASLMFELAFGLFRGETEKKNGGTLRWVGYIWD